MTYAWEKLHLAMHSLAAAGSLKARLRDAYGFHLLHLEVDELPEDVRPVFRQLRDDLGGGDLEAAQRIISALSEEQAQAQVDAILVIHDAVARREGNF